MNNNVVPKGAPPHRQKGLRVNNKLWIISDTHFGHKNIIKFQQRPESHEIIMLSEWIKYVGEEDQILHLGDVFMGKQGNPKRWAAVVNRLPGQKFLIKGNHDKSTAILASAGFTLVHPFIVNGFAFTHEPISDLFPYEPEDEYATSEWHTNIHGHCHGNTPHPADGNIFPDKTYINLSVELTNYKPVQLGNVWK